MDCVATEEEPSLSTTHLVAAQEFVNLNYPPSFPKEPLTENPIQHLFEQGVGNEAINAATIAHCPSPLRSEGSGMDRDPSLSSATQADSPPLHTLASGAQHSENSAAYFLWPTSYKLHGSAGSRIAFFNGLQKDLDVDIGKRAPTGPQAATLLDVMTIRAYHSKRLRRVSLGTAVGFRTRHGSLTSIPAIIVFVARKVHKAWLQEGQRLPTYLEGPGGVWCDVDVVEFAYYGAPAFAPKEQVYTELVEGLRGNDPRIGPGSQVASHETFGTLGAIVQSRTGARQVGFLTNRHVAVDLDYPNQKMFHPLPPIVGPGVYLGAVERATSFITDDRWYSIFASVNPETFVRADGAFIPFADSFDLSRVTTTVRGVGGMGGVEPLGLQAPISSIVGRQVIKVGRSSGLTKGSIMAYALEYNDEKGICFFTDFLIVGEDKQAFDLEGDSGSLILMVEEGPRKPRPVGIIWGGTANRGRLKLRNGHVPENWTSGVDLGRLLECLQLDLITSDAALEEAIVKQRRLACGASNVDIVEDNEPSIFGNSPLEVESEANQAAHGSDRYLANYTNAKVYCNAAAHVLDFEGEPIDFLGAQNFRHQCIPNEYPEDMPALYKPGNAERCFDLNVSSKEPECRWL